MKIIKIFKKLWKKEKKRQKIRDDVLESDEVQSKVTNILFFGLSLSFLLVCIDLIVEFSRLIFPFDSKLIESFFKLLIIIVIYNLLIPGYVEEFLKKK